MKIVVWAIVALLLAALAVSATMAGRFSRRVTALEARLAATPAAALRGDLPAPVAAFARRGMLGAAPVGAVRLTQTAEMRLRKGADWSPLTARQINAMAEPGFAWVAEQRLGPVPLVRVLDSYAAGAGLLEVRLAGAFPLGRYDGPEAALSESLRYLAELPWFPDAILTNRAIAWAEVEGGVTASLDTAGGLAVVQFGFDSAGDIVTMTARDRPATQPDGSIAPLDWQGSFGDYAELGGRRLPRSGEVGYLYPDGYEAYFRGTVTGYTPLD